MIKIIFKISANKNIVKRALWVALVVGIILNLINQGSSMVSGNFNELNLNKLLLTFMVPYMVSTFSAVLSKISLLPGDLANISVKARCAGCGKSEIELIKGDWVPYCDHCENGTKWKIIKLLENNVVLQKQREKSLALLAQYNPNPVLRINDRYEILYYNEMVRAIFGEQLNKEKSILAFLPALDSKTIDTCIRKGLVVKHAELVNDKHLAFELRGIPELKICQIYASEFTG